MFKVKFQPQFLHQLPAGGLLGGFTRLDAAANGDVPEIGPAILEGLPLLDEHVAPLIEDADMDHQTAQTIGDVFAPGDGAAGEPAAGIIEVEAFHNYTL